MNKRIVKFTKLKQIKLVALHGAWVGDYFYRLFFNRYTGKFVVFEEEEDNVGRKTLLPVNPSMIDIVNSKFIATNCLNLTLSGANEVTYTVNNIVTEVEILATTESELGLLVYACGKDLTTGKIGLYYKCADAGDTEFELDGVTDSLKIKTLNALLNSLVTNLENK